MVDEVSWTALVADRNGVNVFVVDVGDEFAVLVTENKVNVLAGSSYRVINDE